MNHQFDPNRPRTSQHTTQRSRSSERQRSSSKQRKRRSEQCQTTILQLVRRCHSLENAVTEILRHLHKHSKLDYDKLSNSINEHYTQDGEGIELPDIYDLLYTENSKKIQKMWADPFNAHTWKNDNWMARLEKHDGKKSLCVYPTSGQCRQTFRIGMQWEDGQTWNPSFKEEEIDLRGGNTVVSSSRMLDSNTVFFNKYRKTLYDILN